MPLEPPEYPPPNPPPLAFAKDTVGTPISDTTIIAAKSFVEFMMGVLSAEARSQPLLTRILADVVLANYPLFFTRPK